MPSNSRDLPAGRQEKAKEEKKFHLEVARQMVTLSTSGFGLVAALAWNNLIREVIDSYVARWIPGDEGALISLFVYAVIVTSLAVAITLQLSRIVRRLEK